MGAAPGTVIISGGGQGIGRATARRLLTQGWRIVIAEQDLVVSIAWEFEG